MSVLFSGGRDRRFLELLSSSAENLREIADLLARAVAELDGISAWAGQAKELERRGDSYTHELVQLINKTFVTPLDREDLFGLAVRIDDVVDSIEAVIWRLTVYRRAAEGDPYLQRFAAILRECAAEIVTSIGLLERKEIRKLRDHSVRLNLLENDADQVLREALAALFSGDPDPVRVIQLKEIYETLEQATDRCEDVADTLEGVAMKYA